MPHARLTDPSTSHEAAASVSNVSKTRSVILSLLELSNMTDPQLVDAYNHMVSISAGIVPAASDSGIRSRRAELVDAGLVKDTGKRVKLPSGRNAIVWQVC